MRILPAEELFEAALQREGLAAKEDHIIIGLSGGPDSVCLFHLLVMLAETWKFKLYPVHINHQLRPGHAERDQAYAEGLAKEHGLVCRTYTQDCGRVAKEKGISGEEAGRHIRYAAFKEVASEIRGTGIPASRIKVAVAHNKNDQAETILFRILRGTGPDGLSGMDYEKELEHGVMLIRPLLDVGRADIETYCREHGLKPMRDHTNFEPIYIRNKVRLELLPLLREEYNPNIEEAILRLGDIASEDRRYLEGIAQTCCDGLMVKQSETSCRFELRGLLALDPPIRRRVILLALAEIGLPMDVEYVHLKQAEAILASGKTGSKMNLPGGYMMELSYEWISFYLDREKPCPDQALPELAARIIPHGEYRPIKGAAAFDFDRLSAENPGMKDPASGIRIRTRRPGDYIVLPGVGGRKLLQDFLVDEKVPRDLRDRIPVAALGNEILWIPGGLIPGRFSGNYRVTDGTKTVLSLEMTY